MSEPDSRPLLLMASAKKASGVSLMPSSLCLAVAAPLMPLEALALRWFGERGEGGGEDGEKERRQKAREASSGGSARRDQGKREGVRFGEETPWGLHRLAWQ